MQPPVIRITVNGRRAETVDMAAARKGVGASSMRGEISRYKVQPVVALDAKKKLYLARDIDRMWQARPGTGSPGKPRGRSAPTARDDQPR